MIQALFDNPVVTTAEGFGCADTTTSEMRSAIKEWFGLYFAREVTDDEDPCQRIPYAVVSRFSKTVFCEYDSGILNAERGGTAAWHDANRRALDAVKKDALQWMCVGGEALLKPVVCGANFAFRVLRRDCYAVLGRAPDGSITALGTAETAHEGGRWYTLLEKRTLDKSGLMTIENKLFSSVTRTRIGTRIALTQLPRYAALPSRYTYRVPLGGLGVTVLRMPVANSVDGSPDGVCLYAPASGLIRNINRNERQLDTEFDNGQNRLFGSGDLLTSDGKGGKKIADTLFSGFEGYSPKEVPLTAWNPLLRNESYEARKQGYLKAVETVIGIKRGIFSNVESVEKTAQEITSSAGDYSLSISDLQNVWFDAVRAALVLCGKLGVAYGMQGAAEFDPDLLTVSWGNGVLYDKRQEWLDDLAAVQAGLLRPEIALAHKYDLPWDTAADLAAIRQKYMPELADLKM